MKFKHFVLLLGTIMALSFSSCSRFTQVVYISPDNEEIQTINHFYTYENNDMKVVYWFWADHGIMSFLLWNKTDKPIYIDWKKCAMISNGKKMSYYTDKNSSNYKNYGATFSMDWMDVFNQYYALNGNGSISKQTLVKGERISFIPPKSYITQAFYNLTANIYFDITDRNTQEETINFCKVYVTKSNQDIYFRNYLTYAFNEEFKGDMHIDNPFKLNKVVTMDNSIFGFKDVDGHWANDWERPTRFYIKNLSWRDVYK